MDTSNQLSERIKMVMSAVFNISISEISYKTSKDDIESWDSLKHLNLILALEEEFDISIPDEEVGNLINFELIKYTIDECTNK
jgi:acyl carrier protein